MDNDNCDKFSTANILSMPALCEAAASGNEEMVDKLLACGADVESKAKGGMTALMLAALFGYENIFKNLLNYGARVEAQNEAGFKALDYIDPRHLMYSQDPFYDITFCKRDKIAKINCASEIGLLHRRKKSLPKIIIQQDCTAGEWRERCSSCNCNSGKFRYSPYLRNGSRNQKKEVLSPNVANFFGNILQMQNSNVSPIVPNGRTLNRVHEKTSYSFCPILLKVLRDNGCEDLMRIFEYHEVNYQVFCTLSDVDLMQLGISNVYHRDLLLRIIKKQQHLDYYKY